MAKRARKPVRKAAKPAKKTAAKKPTAVKRGAAFKSTKQSVTIRLDTDVVAWFKKKADKYQTEINSVLRQKMVRSGGRVPPPGKGR